MFQPIYRPHAHEAVASEPVFRSDKAKKLAKESIELRYQLLPYNYHLAYLNSHEGAPLMRPLLFEEPSKSHLNTLSSTYLWGHDFLVSPILEAGAQEQEVYFPATSNWYDFYSGEKVEGGQTIKVKTKENSIPTYVRAGAFILMTDAVQNTEEYDATNLELHYYHEKGILKSEREYYNDDGKTPNAFEKGKYELLEFETEIDQKWIEIDFEVELGANYKHSQKTLKLVVHNIDWRPRIVRINGKKAGLNKVGNTLVIPVNWNTKEEAKIKISLEAK